VRFSAISASSCARRSRRRHSTLRTDCSSGGPAPWGDSRSLRRVSHSGAVRRTAGRHPTGLDCGGGLRGKRIAAHGLWCGVKARPARKLRTSQGLPVSGNGVGVNAKGARSATVARHRRCAARRTRGAGRRHACTHATPKTHVYGIRRTPYTTHIPHRCYQPSVPQRCLASDP
jgi:hypothetical protein